MLRHQSLTRQFSVACALRQTGAKKPPTIAELLARVKPFQESQGPQQQRGNKSRNGGGRNYDRKRFTPGKGSPDQVVARSLGKAQNQSTVKSTFDEMTPYYASRQRKNQQQSSSSTLTSTKTAAPSIAEAGTESVTISRKSAPWQQGKRARRAESIAGTLTNDVIEGVMKETSTNIASDNVEDYLPRTVRQAKDTRSASFAQRRHRMDRRQASRRTPVGRQRQQQQQRRTGGNNRKKSSSSARRARGGDNSRMLSDRTSLSARLRELDIAIFLKRRVRGRNGIMSGHGDAKSTPTCIDTASTMGLNKDYVHNPGFAVSTTGLMSKAQAAISNGGNPGSSESLSPFQTAVQEAIYEQVVLGDYKSNQLNKGDLGAPLNQVAESVLNRLNRNEGLSPQDKLAIISAITKQAGAKTAAAAKRK